MDIRRIATNGLIIILTLFVVLHSLILSGVIPFNMVWGGRLKDASQMLSFEAVSITVNLIMLAIVLIKAGILKVRMNRMILNIALWAMFRMFMMNTVGNALSNNELEKLLFTPLTILLSLFSLRLATSKDPKPAY